MDFGRVRRPAIGEIGHAAERVSEEFGYFWQEQPREAVATGVLAGRNEKFCAARRTGAADPVDRSAAESLLDPADHRRRISGQQIHRHRDLKALRRLGTAALSSRHNLHPPTCGNGRGNTNFSTSWPCSSRPSTTSL